MLAYDNHHILTTFVALDAVNRFWMVGSELKIEVKLQ